MSKSREKTMILKKIEKSSARCKSNYYQPKTFLEIDCLKNY